MVAAGFAESQADRAHAAKMQQDKSYEATEMPMSKQLSADEYSDVERYHDSPTADEMGLLRVADKLEFRQFLIAFV